MLRLSNLSLPLHHPDEAYIVYNDMPKLKALHERFPALLKAHT